MIGRSRRPSLTVILVAVMLILLPLLAYLQYEWQGKVSERLREQMQETMKRQAAQFGEDFDRQIAQVYASFQPVSRPSNPPNREAQLRQDYAALYSRWKQSALYPGLVSAVYLVPRLGAAAQDLERLNPLSGEFEQVEWPAEMLSLRKQTSRVSMLRFGPAAEQLIQLPASSINRQIPALVIPIMDAATVAPGAHFDIPLPAPVSEAIVKLSLPFMQEELIPALAKQYIAASDGTPAYNMAIVDQSPPRRVIYASGPPAAADAAGDITADIFVSRPMDVQRMMTAPAAIYASREILRNHTIGSDIVSVQVQRNTTRGPVTFFEASPGSNPWQLVLTHQSGSLDTAVAQARARNLAISFGILLLLAVSVAMILMSSQRERRLAQQQMEFVSAVSHELRTPLAVICSAGENLADGIVSDQEQTRQYGALVRNEGRRLTEMVEQVLDFAGIQSGQKSYRFDATEVKDIIDRALQTFDLQIRDTGVVLETRIAGDVPMIMADRPALVRALQNLISNALKYGDSGKFLSVRADARADHVTITVEDRGGGIAPLDLPHVFEPFYRSRSVVDAQIKGSGLGLSLVRQIVEAHQATIAVESAAGKGTAFTITLPRAETAKTIIVSHDQAYSPR